MNKFKSFVLRHKLSFATACATAVAACPTLAAEGVSGSGYIQSAWISDLLPNISADVLYHVLFTNLWANFYLLKTE